MAIQKLRPLEIEMVMDVDAVSSNTVASNFDTENKTLISLVEVVDMNKFIIVCKITVSTSYVTNIRKTITLRISL